MGYRSESVPRPASRWPRFRMAPSIGSENTEHELIVVEGSIEIIYAQRHRLVRGASFAIGAETSAGQSGGPVFNDDGYVCGVHSGVVLEEAGQVGIASMIYPTLASTLRYDLRLGGDVSLAFGSPVIQLIKAGVIKTDGSEARLRIVHEEKASASIRSSGRAQRGCSTIQQPRAKAGHR